MRRRRTVSAGVLQLSGTQSGSIYIRDRVEGQLSFRKPTNLTLTFAPNAGVRSNQVATGALEFGFSPELSVSTNGGSTNTVSSAVTVGATSLSVTASIAPGYYMLGSRNRASITGSNLQGDGEIVYVTTTGTTATLSSPTTKAYDNGSNIRFILESTGNVGLNNGVIGGTFEANNSNTDGIGAPWVVAFQTQIGLKVNGITSIGGRVDSVRALACQDFEFKNVIVRDCQSPEGTVTGTGYSFAVNWSNSGVVNGVGASRSRHAIGFHRGCHNITGGGSNAVNTAFAFDIHDYAENLTFTGIVTPYKAFSDGISRVAKNYGQVAIGNQSHVNKSTNITLGGIKAGDVFVNYAVENLTITDGECRRLWFVQTAAGTHGAASTFKTSTINMNRHGLCRTTANDPGETAVGVDTALSTTRIGTSNAIPASFDRVRVRGNSECFSPSHGIDGRANTYGGTWTDYAVRIDTGTIRVKTGESAGGNPMRLLGFGSALATDQRFEFEGLDIYQASTATLAIQSDYTTSNYTVAIENNEFSINGAALSAMTTNNITSGPTRSGSVTSIVEPIGNGPATILNGQSVVFGPFTVADATTWDGDYAFTLDAFGSEMTINLDPAPSGGWSSNNPYINDISGLDTGPNQNTLANLVEAVPGPWTGNITITASGCDLVDFTFTPPA